jgi:hypothetical protein
MVKFDRTHWREVCVIAKYTTSVLASCVTVIGCWRRHPVLRDLLRCDHRRVPLLVPGAVSPCQQDGDERPHYNHTDLEWAQILRDLDRVEEIEIERPEDLVDGAVSSVLERVAFTLHPSTTKSTPT